MTKALAKTKGAAPPAKKSAAKSAPAAPIAHAPTPPVSSGKFMLVDWGKIFRWADNPRKKFNQQRIEELAADMRINGMIKPLVVREHALAPGGYQLIAGERRHRAAEIAELGEVPILVRELTDEQAYDLASSENTHSDALLPMEESDAYKRMVDRFHRSVPEISLKSGKSQAHIYQMLSLQNLSPAVRPLFEEGKFGVSIAIELARIHNHPQQERAAGALISQKVSNLTDARTFIRSRYVLPLADAKFDIADAKLVEVAGACTLCPKNTATQTAMFPGDDADEGNCLDEACWAVKNDAHWRQLRDKAHTNGQRVIEGPEAAKIIAHGSVRFDGQYEDLDRSMYVESVPTLTRKAIGPFLKKHPEVLVHVRSEEGVIFEVIDKKVLERAKKDLNLQPKKKPPRAKRST